MSWYNFLKDNEKTILDKIRGYNEENFEFYNGVLIKDNNSYRANERGKEASNATKAVFVHGKATDSNHALWVNFWSRDKRELEGLEEAVKQDSRWKYAGGEKGESIYLSENISMLFRREGVESTAGGIEIRVVNSQKDAFKKEVYLAKVQGFIEWVMMLLKEKQPNEVIQRQPSQQGAAEQKTEVYLPADELTIEDIKNHYEIFGRGIGVAVGVNNAYIVINNNSIELEVEDVAIKTQDTLPAFDSYSVKPTQKGILIRRRFRAEPTKPQMLTMVKDAEKIIDVVSY